MASAKGGLQVIGTHKRETRVYFCNWGSIIKQIIIISFIYKL